MSTNKTSNFGLNQWEPGDQVLREEFNADNAKIDGALPRIVTGSYIGTGVAAPAHYSLGMRPKLLILVSQNNYSSNTRDLFFFAIEGVAFNFNSAGGQAPYFGGRVTFDDDGFTIDHSGNNINLGYNREGFAHHYWAMC